MFTRGATPGKVKEWTYHEDEEDFTKGQWMSLVARFGVSMTYHRCDRS